MKNIFDVAEFDSPYTDLVFPGKAEDEKILYVTRESPVMLAARLFFFILVVGVGVGVGAILVGETGKALGFGYSGLIVVILLMGIVVMCFGFWWIYQVYFKTMFIITTRRLTKFIHTTPWNRYQMSLTLDKVVDSGAYSKGYLQAMFGLGTFVARSSAGNIKNFKIENISFAEDLHNWMNKLMFVFTQDKDKLDNFRPFSAKKIGERY